MNDEFYSREVLKTKTYNYENQILPSFLLLTVFHFYHSGAHETTSTAGGNITGTGVQLAIPYVGCESLFERNKWLCSAGGAATLQDFLNNRYCNSIDYNILGDQKPLLKRGVTEKPNE